MIVDWNRQLVDEADACVRLSGQPTALSDGIYETLRCYKGVPFDLESHLRRMREGCERLGLDSDIADARWRSRIHQLLEVNELSGQNARIRIVVHRPFNIDISRSVNVAILAWPVASHSLADRQLAGVSAVTSSIRRLPDCPLYKLKSLNLLATSLGQQEARAAGADEALFVNASGEYCEATYSNLFVVTKDDLLKSPPLSSPCLPGVTRMHVLRMARREGWMVQEKPVSLEDLRQAKEVFLTSSVSEIMPVRAIDDSPVGTGLRGSVCTMLQKRYSQLVIENLAKASTSE